MELLWKHTEETKNIAKELSRVSPNSHRGAIVNITIKNGGIIVQIPSKGPRENNSKYHTKDF